MNNAKFHKFLIALVSLYSGIIATDCIRRIFLSLVRHGLMHPREATYDLKVILVVTVYLSYRYLKKMLDHGEKNFYINFVNENLLFLAGLVIATRLVFSQFSSLYSIFIHPLERLFLIW
jgi:hypothetical protein